MAGDDTDITGRPDTCCCIEITCSRCKTNRTDPDDDLQVRPPEWEGRRHGNGTGEELQSDVSEPVRGPSVPPAARSGGGAKALFSTSYREGEPRPHQGESNDLQNGNRDGAASASSQAKIHIPPVVNKERTNALSDTYREGNRAILRSEQESTYTLEAIVNDDPSRTNYERRNTSSTALPLTEGEAQDNDDRVSILHGRASGSLIPSISISRHLGFTSSTDFSTMRRAVPAPSERTLPHQRNREEIEAILARYRPGGSQTLGSLPITNLSPSRSTSTSARNSESILTSTSNYMSSTITSIRSYTLPTFTSTSPYTSSTPTSTSPYTSSTLTSTSYYTSPTLTSTNPYTSPTLTPSGPYTSPILSSPRTSPPSVLTSSFTSFRSSLDREFEQTLSRLGSPGDTGGQSYPLTERPAPSSSSQVYNSTLFDHQTSALSRTSSLTQGYPSSLSQTKASDPRSSYQGHTSRYARPRSNSYGGLRESEQLPSWTAGTRAASSPVRSGRLSGNTDRSCSTERSLANTNEWLRSRIRPLSFTKWGSTVRSPSTTTFPTSRDFRGEKKITGERGRAKETIHEMQHSLQREPTSVRRQRTRRSRSVGSSGYHEHSDYTYGAAVDRLRHLLDRHDTTPHKKTVQFSPRSSGHFASEASYQGADGGFVPSRSLPLPPRGELPSAEDTVRLLQNQSVLVQQMEAENRYCKSELQELKTKVKTLIDENRLLHEELKRSVVAEILQGDIEVPGVPTSLGAPSSLLMSSGRAAPPSGNTQNDRPMTIQDYGKWQRELERITTLHTAKTSRLEAQLAHAREEVTKYESEVETVRAKLRMQESMGGVGPVGTGMMGLAFGLCIRCSENEAVTPATLANQQATVDRITKERDELMDQLTGMKTRVQEMRQREEDAYAQVKKSVEMVEQAQLEQTQALVQREQLKEELLNMRRRMEEHVEEVQNKMVTERDIVRQETKAERDELNGKLKEMTERLVAAEMQLDKTTRDKVSLMAELEAARGELNEFDTDYNKATDSMKMSMTHATVERNAAISELKRSKVEVEQLQKEKDYEIQRARTELKDLRRRLSMAEKELLESKEQSIHLTTEIQALSRETHLAKLAKESIEKNRSDDMKALTRRAETREEELNMLIETLENKHGRTTSELDEIIRTQNSLIQKLREECRHLTRQLEKLTSKYKGDNKHLSSTNGGLKLSLDKARRRAAELERQNEQHAALAEKMRQRLRQMDEHAKRGSGQILELLAKESSLMRDRQLLAHELEFLRREATAMDDSDVDKLLAARNELIDDVLDKVRREEPSSGRGVGGAGQNNKTATSALLIETDRGMQTDDLSL